MVMKRTVFIFILALLFNFCGERPERIEKVVEDGVEVVINRLEPYKIKGQPSTFSLEEELIVDFERDDLARLGIGEVRGFEVDSEGNIYFITEPQIFKFDKGGHFIRKFGSQGQGPGEYGYLEEWQMTEPGELTLFDIVNNKFIFFSEEGELLKEIKVPSKVVTASMVSFAFPEDKGFLFDENLFDRNADNFYIQLVVLNGDFDKIKVLREKVNSENPFKSARFNLFRSRIIHQVFKDKIYAVSQQNPDYEINIYDFQGENVRRIRKDFRKVGIPEGYTAEQLGSYKKSTMYRVHKMAGYFPEHYPPIKNFYVDTLGRVYVGTYEEGLTPDAEIVDIFNAEGVFIGRISLKKALSRKFKADRLYALYEKENGFQELVVYRMDWKL